MRRVGGPAAAPARLPARGSRSFVHRIVVTFLVLSTVMIGVVATVAYVRAKSELQTSAKLRLASVQVLARESLERWLDEQRRNVKFVSGLLGGVEREGTLPGLRGAVDALFSEDGTEVERARAARVVGRTLSYAVEQSSDAQELLVIDRDGRVLISTVPSHVGRSLFVDGVGAIGSTRVVPLGRTDLGGEPTVVVTTPLYDDFGRARATLAATLDVRRLDQTVLARTGLGTGGRTYLVSSDRRVFARGPAQPVSSLAIERGLAGQAGQASYDDYTGTPVIGSWAWVPSIGAALVSEVPTSVAFAPAGELARWITLIGAAVVAVLAGLTLLGARRIARPILAITEAAEGVRAGDLERSAPVMTRDEVGSLAVAFNDMTEQMRRNVAELEQRVRERTQELSTQKNYFETLVEISPAAVVTMDTELTVTGWNPAAERLFGYRSAEAVGRHVDNLVLTSDTLPGDTVPGGGDEEDPERGQSYRVAQRARKDGSLVDIEIVMVPLTVDGRQVGSYAVYHDVTELQEARLTADRANEAKSAFLAAMSHEIRTPLNAIIGLGRLLNESKLTPEQAEFAGSIAASGESLLAVINDVLDLSKVEAGRMEVDLNEVDPVEIVEEAVELLGSTTDWQTGVVLDVSGDVPARVVSDGVRLRQIVLNLVGNAVKFSERGRVVVAVRAAGIGSAGSTARLLVSVTDNGVGITPEQQERLFASFVQATAQTQRRYGGTGLGLAISRRLAELMGGTLRLTSPVTDGRGSRFVLDVPVEVVEAATDPRQDSLAGCRVEVRHRDPVVTDVLVERLQEAGADVGTGERLDGSRWEGSSVAILDAAIPGVDAMLRDRGSVPIVLISRVPRWHAAEQLGWAPPESVPWLTEPVRTRSLIRSVLSALGATVSAGGTGGPPDIPSLPQLRVLVAEDNAVNQTLIRALLARVDIVPDIVEDGAAAVVAVAEKCYDVALLDLRMPIMDGLEAARSILADATPGARLPVLVALTADVGETDRKAAREAGLSEFLAKPLREEELHAVLARVPPPHGSVTTAAAMVRLQALAGDDEELAKELVATFVEGVPALVAELDDAAELMDAANLRRVAHTLKSHGALLGDAVLEERARELESMVIDGHLEEAVAAAPQLRMTVVEASGRWEEVVS